LRTNYKSLKTAAPADKIRLSYISKLCMF